MRLSKKWPAPHGGFMAGCFSGSNIDCKTIHLAKDCIYIGETSIYLGNIICVAININAAARDRIGGSVVLVTSEVAANHMAVQKQYCFSVSKDALALLRQMERLFAQAGITVRQLHMDDKVFRKAFSATPS